MLDRELVAAVKLARDAGAVLMEVYATDFDVEDKGGGNPVTEADRRANDMLVHRIRETFPTTASSRRSRRTSLMPCGMAAVGTSILSMALRSSSPRTESSR